MIKLVKNQGAVDLSKKMMKGDDGGYYIPTVDNEGNLSWSGSEAEMPAIEGANIQGPQGDPGYNTVWIGTEAPEDPNMTVWVDIDGKPTEGLATKGYVDEAIANVPGADLSNYYTKEEVNEAIDGISDCGFDSKDYYTKTEVDSMIPITTGLATEQYVDDAIAAIDIPDLSEYALKSEIPSTTGFITMSDVEAKGYQTETQVNSLINTALAAINIAEEGEY